MRLIQKMSTVLALNIVLVSGTVYLTDKWGYLQPFLLVGGCAVLFIAFPFTDMKIKIHTMNFALYSGFIFCCLLSALLNGDFDLCIGALVLYSVYLSLSIVFPSICGINHNKYDGGKINFYSYLYVHLPVLVLPLVLIGINKIPYSGIFINPNSFGAISATAYIMIFAKFSHIIDSAIMDKNIKITNIMMNGILLLGTLTLTIISRSRTSFITVICITIFYFVISLCNFITNGKINISILIRAIIIIFILTAISSFIIFETGIYQLFKYTIINKMIIKSGDLTSGRIDIWYRAVNESRLFGNGRNYFIELGGGAYSTYISVLGQYGIIPTLLYFGFLINLLYNSFIYLRSSKTDSYRYFPIYSTMTFMLLSVGEGMFFTDSMMLIYSAIGSITYNTSDCSEHSSDNNRTIESKNGEDAYGLQHSKSNTGFCFFNHRWS